MSEQNSPTAPSEQSPQPGDNIAVGGVSNSQATAVGAGATAININLERAAKEKYATRADYLAQIIDRHQDLEFVGIPELKDRQALRIDDVFIHLQAEAEEPSDEAALTQLRDRRHRFDRQPIRTRVSVNAALSRHTRIVVLGDPGAGKTTLLKYITVAFAEGAVTDRLGLNEERLPIFIRLYDYVAKRPDKSERGLALTDYLYVQARENLQITLKPGFFESELESGGCCVCLDGLDELGEAGLRRDVTRAVESLVNHYPRNRYVITSRVVGYNEAPLDTRNFAHHTVLELSDDDIKLFVQKWYAMREKDPTVRRERAEHLTNTLIAEERLKSLARNPLLLTIIALVHRIEADLPNERVKLYDKCVTALVDTWDKVKNVTPADRERPYYTYRRRLLEQLAYWMHTQTGESGKAREVRAGSLRQKLTEFLIKSPKLQLDHDSAWQEAHDFVQLVRSRTGLLMERGEGVLAFSHLTIQEFMAACDIERRLAHNLETVWTEIELHLHDPNWREVILLLIGSLNRYDEHPTELVKRILARVDDYEAILHRNLFLVVRVLLDNVDIDARLEIEIVIRLLRLVQSDELAGKDAEYALNDLVAFRRKTANLVMSIYNDPSVPLGLRHTAHAALQLAATWPYSKEATTFEESPTLDRAEYIGDGVNWEREMLSSLLLSTLGIDLQAIDEDKPAVVLQLKEKIADPKATDLQKYNAAKLLQKLGLWEEALAYFWGLASDKSVYGLFRRNAAQELLRSGLNEQAFEVLLDLANNQNISSDVRLSSMYTLATAGYHENTPRLIMELANDKRIPIGTRRAAYESLKSLLGSEARKTYLSFIL